MSTVNMSAFEVNNDRPTNTFMRLPAEVRNMVFSYLSYDTSTSWQLQVIDPNINAEDGMFGANYAFQPLIEVIFKVDDCAYTPLLRVSKEINRDYQASQSFNTRDVKLGTDIYSSVAVPPRHRTPRHLTETLHSIMQGAHKLTLMVDNQGRECHVASTLGLLFQFLSPFSDQLRVLKLAIHYRKSPRGSVTHNGETHEYDEPIEKHTQPLRETWDLLETDQFASYHPPASMFGMKLKQNLRAYRLQVTKCTDWPGAFFHISEARIIKDMAVTYEREDDRVVRLPIEEYWYVEDLIYWFGNMKAWVPSPDCEPSDYRARWMEKKFAEKMHGWVEMPVEE